MYQTAITRKLTWFPFVLKKVTKRDSVGLKKGILNSVADNVKDNKKLPLDTTRHIRKPVHKTFHGTPKPSKQELLDKRITRMSKPGPSIELRKYTYLAKVMVQALLCCKFCLSYIGINRQLYQRYFCNLVSYLNIWDREPPNLDFLHPLCHPPSFSPKPLPKMTSPFLPPPPPP